jgi:hypothetical protein
MDKMSFITNPFLTGGRLCSSQLNQWGAQVYKPTDSERPG